MGSWENPLAMSPEFLSLLRLCLVLALFIHLPFIGVIIGGSAVSLLMNFLGREKGDQAYLSFSKELMETVWINKFALFLLGLFPILPIGLIYKQILSGSGLLPGVFWFFLFGVLLTGVIFLSFYRTSFRFRSDMPAFSIGTGAIGHLTLVFAYVLFIFGTGIIFNPEKLPFLRERFILFLSWNSVVKFLLFSLLFIGMTGGVILLFMGKRSEEGETQGPKYGKLADTTGKALTLMATLGLPVFIVLNLLTLPDIALSGGIFALSSIILFLSLTLFLILYFSFEVREGWSSPLVFVLFMLIFLSVLLNDHLAMGNALQERRASLHIQAEKQKAEREATREEATVKEPGIEEKGKAVFERVCTGCHRFDSKLIGPPLREVLPKYDGDREKLKGYIKNPVKVDPEYPPMPKLGLSEDEIEAVAAYLLGRI